MAPKGLADLLEEARGLLAHRLPAGASLAEVVQALAKLGLERIKKERFGVGTKARKGQSEKKEVKGLNVEVQSMQPKNDVDVDVRSTDPGVQKSKRSRHIPMPVRRAVFKRADGKCEYNDPITKRRCNSSKYLQLHHTTAFAKGGEHVVEGLAAYCSNHNKLAAVDDFGMTWMSKFQKIQGQNVPAQSFTI